MRGGTRETAVWLGRYRRAEQEIGRLLDEIQQARSNAERVTAVFSAVAGGYSEGNPIERLPEIVAAIQGRILAQLERQQAIKAEVEAAIGQLKNHNQQDVLRYVYINGKTVAETAEALHYSERHTYDLKNGGMMCIKRIASAGEQEETTDTTAKGAG